MSAAFEGLRITRRSAFELPIPPHAALRLFEPEGERAWAKGWDPRYVYPADGRTEAGMVFTTGEGAEHTTWLMSRHDAPAGEVEYVRLTAGSRLGLVRVRCEPAGAAATRVTVEYRMTGLSEEGNARLEALDESAFETFIGEWARAIDSVIGENSGFP